MSQKINKAQVAVIGAGLAGSEAAYQLARRGIPVVLMEMRPQRMTPAHKTGLPAEIVCSNSLKSDRLDTASGLLKWELRQLNSLILKAADNNRVPAGQALAVDREKFSKFILQKLSEFENLRIERCEITSLPREGGITIIATGPLTSPPLASQLKQLVGEEYLFFYDAVSPIVLADSINMEKVFAGSRYNKGTADYLNCPMSAEEYSRFYNELIKAEQMDIKDFEKGHFFEGCLPVEELARRGPKTLLFGPLKPVGLDEDAKAVVQLRKENRQATMYSLVGFQTRLKWGEQKRVFRMIPGLENARFVRFGVMHKNIYVNSPRVLNSFLQLKKRPDLLFAGQITGVEGYVESAAMGMVAGLNVCQLFYGRKPELLPRATAIGSLINYVTGSCTTDFQPMNVNFGIFPPVKVKAKKREKRKIVVKRAMEALENWIDVNNYLF